MYLYLKEPKYIGNQTIFVTVIFWNTSVPIFEFGSRRIASSSNLSPLIQASLEQTLEMNDVLIEHFAGAMEHKRYWKLLLY